MTEKILNILKTYKSAINIRDDFKDHNKINSFIPTLKNISLLEEFLNLIMDKKQKAILLSGAYGTGKSYLLSVLLGLLVGKFEKEEICVFIEKVKMLSPEFAKFSENMLKKKYIIVFPKDIFRNFKQAITIGIQEQIEEKNLMFDDITLHKAVLNKIDDFEKNHTLFFNALQNALCEKNIEINTFRQQLKENSQQALDLFLEIYPDIMGGEPFSPEKAITSITELLSVFEKTVLSHGFDGVIYVFDEFGRYLEQNINSIDVKQVQDVAEYCSSGNKSALFLITHKDIMKYSRKVTQTEDIQEWEKVSGRFRREHLLYEEQNINQILKIILQKNEAYLRLRDSKKSCFNKEVKILSCFDNLPEHPQTIIDSLYPLNYICALMLSRISQKLAQNERTMFSFLCGDDRYSLRRIFNNSSENLEFITADRLYNYFEDCFRYLDENEYQYYLNAKSILASLSETEKREKSIIKVIALIYILNQFAVISPKIGVIAAALSLEETEIKNNIEYLKNEGFISNRRDKGNQFYKLVRDIDINVNKEVQKYIQYSLEEFDYTETLSKHIPAGYKYAIKYNDKYKITRYLKVYYIDVADINAIEKKVLPDRISDGKIIYLLDLKKKKLHINEILSIYGQEIIFIQPLKYIDIIENLKELEAVDRILSIRTDIISNDIIKNEFIEYKQETINIIEEKLEEYLYQAQNTKIYINSLEVSCKNQSDFQDAITGYLEAKYSKYFPVNYELINKTKLTATIKKARREILGHICEGTITQDYLDRTGAANSIARIILQETNLIRFKDTAFMLDFDSSIFKELYNDIINFLQKSPKLNDVYTKYASNESLWGLRKGLFSLLLALIIDKHSNDIYISFNRDEVNVTPELFDKFDAKTDGYEICYIEFTEDKKHFLKEMYSQLRRSRSVDNHVFEKNQSMAIFHALKIYIYSTPKLILNQLSKQSTLQKLIQQLSLNNSKDFFFKKIPVIYKDAKNFFEISKNLIDDLSYLEEQTIKIKEQLEQFIRIEMQLEPDIPFKRALEVWGNSIDIKSSQGITKSFIEFAKNISSYEGCPLTVITEKLNGFDFYNWRSNEDTELFKSKLKKISSVKSSLSSSIHKINNYNPQNIELSPLAKLLKSKLKADIKNMGMSVDKEQIKSILFDIIRWHCEES